MREKLKDIWEGYGLAKLSEKDQARLIFAEIAGEVERLERLEAQCRNSSNTTH